LLRYLPSSLCSLPSFLFQLQSSPISVQWFSGLHLLSTSSLLQGFDGNGTPTSPVVLSSWPLHPSVSTLVSTSVGNRLGFSWVEGL
ncbi:hypothetical protein LINPERHAP1_LOCUS36624, partial [Linum perenne]